MPLLSSSELRLSALVGLIFLATVTQGLAGKVTLEQAVKKTFKDNPYIQIENETVTYAIGEYQASLGEFDWLYFMDGYAEQISTPVADGTWENIVHAATGVSKKMRTGITLTPSAGVTDKSSSFTDGHVAQTDVRLKIVVPTLRGFGTEVASATSYAAASALEATRFSSYHNISDKIYTTIVAFYDCLAAQQSYALVNESFERSEVLLTNVRNMIAAGMLEPAFLNQAKAKLYNTQVDAKSGEMSFYETRQTLGLSMGMDAEALISPPFPQGNFPRILPMDRISRVTPGVLIRKARENRMDYLAALETVNGEKILLKQAGNEKKPKLDLTFRLGYMGLSEKTDRYVKSFYDNVNGVSGYAGFQLELPIENRYATGRYMSQASAVTTAKLSATSAFNLISSEVITALENIKVLVSQHELAAKSAERYKSAVSFEKRKYDAGESTLNALIDIEDRYIDAKLAVVETMRKYAVVLAKLRFATGTLLERENEELRFHIRRMTRLPG
jgi:outer membrane protein